MHTRLALAVAAAFGAGGSAVAHDTVPLAALERAYLECDALATRRVPAPAVVEGCSLVAEALLQRGFGGDLDRLLAWWRGARASAAVSAPPPPDQPVRPATTPPP